MKRFLRSLPQAALRPALSLAGVAAAIAAAAALGLLEPVSLAITFGGTLAVACATFSRRRLAAAWRQVAEALRFSAEDDEAASEATIAAFKRLARIQRVDGPPALERAARREGDPFLRAAVERVLEWDDAEELREALLGEARRFAAAGEDARTVLSTLGKLFPAFGLIGTLLGLALMLPATSGGDGSAQWSTNTASSPARRVKRAAAPPAAGSSGTDEVSESTSSPCCARAWRPATLTAVSPRA